MKLFLDLTDDEVFYNGKIGVRIADRDSLKGTNIGLQIGDDIEFVLSVPQMITLYDVLDGWVNGGPIKAMGDIERRILESIKQVAQEHGGAIRAMNSRPEELAHVLYDSFKFHGLRFRLHADERDQKEEPSKIERRMQNLTKAQTPKNSY